MKKLFLSSLGFAFLFTIIPSASDAQWVQTNGPFGGEANALVAIGDTLFACVEGSVHRSTDNGTSWSVTTLMNSLVNSLVAGGENLYAVTGGLGILLSTDRGIEWNAINNTLPSLSVYTLVSSGPDLFVSLRNSVVMAPGYGIYRSKDNGISWAAANTGLADPDVQVLTVCAGASGDTDIYAGTQILMVLRGGT